MRRRGWVSPTFVMRGLDRRIYAVPPSTGANGKAWMAVSSTAMTADADDAQPNPVWPPSLISPRILA